MVTVTDLITARYVEA